MIFSRHIHTTLKGAAALLLSALLWGCAADDFDALRPTDGDYAADTQLVIHLAVPHGESAPATRAVESRPTPDELQINSLHLLVFPIGENAEVIRNLPMMVPSEMAVAPEKGTITYEYNGFKPGSYRMYIIGNIPHETLYSITTEAGLKQVILDYTSKMPEPGNLPMIYEPTGESSFEITSDGTEPEEKTLSLKYACVKMKLNLIFDKSNTTTGTNYGTSGFKPTTLKLNHVSTKAPLVINGQESKVEGDLTIDLADKGKFHTNWTETPGNANVANKEVIENLTAATGTFSDYAGKWLWQTTVYMPERYTATEGGQLEFELEGKLTDASGAETGTTVKFETTPIGVEDGNVKKTDLPRGSYYEFIGKVVNKVTDGNKLNATVTLKSWQDISLPVDFIHTYLTLSKATADVKSLKTDYITYSTDGRGEVTLACETTLDDNNGNPKPVVIATQKFDPGIGQYIELSANPEINITAVPVAQREGDATAYIVAGNIKKKIAVHYDIKPFFQITPLERTIAYVADGENATVFSYRTNLGGVKLTANGTEITSGGTNTIGNSKLEITITGTSTGEIRMTATKDPSTTTVHPFTAGPKNSDSAEEAQPKDITVTVQPPINDYRIYFRAINDYAKHKSTSGYAEEFLALYNYALPSEGGSNNWKDCWNNAATESGVTNHLIYIYNQVGNNADFSDVEKMAVRMFNSFGTSDGTTQMSQDLQNPGWYYFDLSKNPPSTMGSWERKDKATAAQQEYFDIPRPGETLLIFHNSTDGNSIHRLAHSNEAGVQLGSFSDGEGWTLYDPLREPKYTTYDDKPNVVDVTYTIYSDVQMNGWYHIYGTMNANQNDRITMYADRWESNTSNQNKRDGSYYVNTLHFKAVAGEYDKAIKIKFNGYTGSNSETTVSNHYVYFETWNNGDWTNDPQVKFINSQGQSITKRLDWVQDLNGGGKQWRSLVPDGFHDGKVRFISQNNTNYYPAYDAQIYPQYNYIAYSSSSAGKLFNNTDEGQSFIGSPTVMHGVQLFDGNNWTTGTFNSKTGQWTQGRP